MSIMQSMKNWLKDQNVINTAIDNLAELKTYSTFGGVVALSRQGDCFTFTDDILEVNYIDCVNVRKYYLDAATSTEQKRLKNMKFIGATKDSNSTLEVIIGDEDEIGICLLLCKLEELPDLYELEEVTAFKVVGDILDTVYEDEAEARREAFDQDGVPDDYQTKLSQCDSDISN